MSGQVVIGGFALGEGKSVETPNGKSSGVAGGGAITGKSPGYNKMAEGRGQDRPANKKEIRYLD